MDQGTATEPSGPESRERVWAGACRCARECACVRFLGGDLQKVLVVGQLLEALQLQLLTGGQRAQRVGVLLNPKGGAGRVGEGLGFRV